MRRSEPNIWKFKIVQKRKTLWDFFLPFKELEAVDPEGLKEIVKDLRRWVNVDVPWQLWSPIFFR
jgi:hypothetical protein